MFTREYDLFLYIFRLFYTFLSCDPIKPLYYYVFQEKFELKRCNASVLCYCTSIFLFHKAKAPD